MIKIFKYIKEAYWKIAIILVMLCMQAFLDLKLPNMMSKIVNVGIQQSGIEYIAPEFISESTLNEVAKNENSKFILDDYSEIEKNDNNIGKYPLLKEEKIYKKNKIDKEDREKLDSVFKDFYLSREKEIVKEKEEKKEEINKEENKKTNKEEIKTIDPDTLMTDEMKKQAAIMMTKKEYEKIGIDMHKISTKYILETGGIMLLISLVSISAAILISYLSASVAAKFGKNVRDKIYKKVLSFSQGNIKEFSTASLITRTTNDIGNVQNLLVSIYRMIVYAPIMAIGATVMIVQTSNYEMAKIILFAVIAIMLGAVFLFSYVKPLFETFRKLKDKMNLNVREDLTGIGVIRAFNTEKKQEEKFAKTSSELAKINYKTAILFSFVGPVISIVLQIVTILIIWKGAHFIDEGTIQVGDMMAFMQYAIQIIMSFILAATFPFQYQSANVAAKRINEVLEKEEDIKDKNPLDCKKFDNETKGLIEFKNVSFRYPDANIDMLTDLNFTIQPGTTTAIIGGTGSGKSTIINLIMRFYDCTEGEVLIDSVNIKDVEQRDLRSKIAYVSQKAFLFSGTIEENIKLGKNITQNEMERVAKIAQAAEFIEEKENKYQELVSQSGSNLSGGQKQRLSIARALAMNPDIFIFDDSFSALDLKTDRQLRKELNEKLADKTKVIVAQRIATIMSADQIIVIDEGKIVGIGKHEELLESSEVYKQIAMSQLSEEELQKKEVE